ncbi:gamma-tubulin complex component 6-like [Octopus vulgaris]|uniref:Gamma-tubulin complex component 6-like n=1 Tax=Octopus vulgaris TaxID=6645 RepID=A0AA36BNU9_OCTVU|nr:gamma-tubulin complex component 6-like [Octopus vulgaris]
MEVSFVSLVRQLCKHHVEKMIKDLDYFSQPVRLQGDHNQLVKRFQIKAYNALFGYLEQLARQKKTDSNKTSISGINQQLVKLLSWVVVLLQQNKHEESQQLQILVEKLLKLDSDKLESCLRFLLQLAGSCEQKKGLLGYQRNHYQPRKNTMLKLVGFDYLKSTQKYSSENASFMYYSLYPRELFESNGLDCSHDWQEIFAKSPGQGLSDNFRVKNILNDNHENLTQRTLYGALSHRSVYNLDLKLGLPDLLPNQQRHLVCPKIRSVKTVPMRTSSPLFDEGFLDEETSREEEVSPIVTTMEASSNDSGISQPSDLKTSIWDAALSFKPSEHYTWETVGKHPGLQELPYLTEAGPEAVDKIFAVKLNEMSILCPSLQEASKVTVSVKQLVNDILQLLVGVSSHLFLLNKETQKFYMKDWICVSGLTPTSVDNLLAPFVESGSIYHQLSLLVQLPVHKITDSGGHTYQAFIQAIDNYLLYYRAAVLSIPKDITLLQLEFYCRRLVKQLKFLSGLCHSNGQINSTPSIPVGLELLDYLYKKTVEMWDSEQYYLMLSIFQRACTPFALYLQNWVFHGVCKDEYGEFMIKISDNIVQLTGKENWNDGFQLQIPSTANGFLEFLSGVLHDIFTCGQSLNLIRICNPQHFICNVNNNEVPQIRFFHSKNELKSLQQYSQCYFSRLHQIARQTMQARLERKEKLIQMKKDLAAKAQEMAASELKRINTELENIKKLQQEKKKKEFQLLKEQMEEAQLRKLKEKEMRKKADELSEKEQSLMKAKAEMEAEIKEKIKRHYADLSEQAALREEKALWNVRRARLNDQRTEFLKAEERKWKAIMEEWKSKQTKDDNVDGIAILPQELDPNLPQWAKSALTTARTGQEAELRDVDPNLPSWARHGDSKPLMTIVDDADREEEKEDSPSLPIAKVLSEEKLPSWAKKGISSVDGVVKDIPLGSGESGDTVTKQKTAGVQFPQKPEAGDQLIYPNSFKTVKRKTDSTNTDSGIKSVDQQTPTASKPISPPEEQPLVSHRKQVEGHSITKESSATPEVDQVTLHRKQVENQSISKESAPTSGGDTIIPHKKQVEDQSVSKESAPMSGGDVIIPHKKQVEDQSVSKESSTTSGGDTIIPHKKQVEDQSVSKESSTTSGGEVVIPHKKQVDDQFVSKESSATSGGDTVIPRRKQVTDQCVSNESAAISRGDVVIPHRKWVENQSVSKENYGFLPETQVVHRRKSVDSQGIHQQTYDASPTDLVVHRKKKVPNQSVTQESSESTLNYRHSGIFISPALIGHGYYEFELPVLKQPKDLYAQETDMKDFSIRRKSGVFLSDDLPVVSSSLSSQLPKVKTHNKMSSTMSATTESEPTDDDASKRARFKQRNIHGHASDSTIQKLLYGRKTSSSPENQPNVDNEEDRIGPAEGFEAMFKSWKESFTEPYNCSFNFESGHLLNIGGNLNQIASGRSGISSNASVEDLEAYHQSPLSVLIQQSIQNPLMDQIKLVNKCALDYFLTELSIEEHFSAMWRYLIMGEGDFAFNLTSLLFEKLSMNPHPNEILNPIFLNSIINQAFKCSISAEDKYIKNLSFEITEDSSSTVKDDAKILECLNLAYKVDWPLNIIINKECHRKYRQLYLFLLQLRYAMWLLEQIWRQLKRDAMVNHVPHFSRETQFHRVQTFGYIMREFVKALQNFFVNQVLYISWTNFQKAFHTKVFSLDDLHKLHMDFLDTSLKQSLFMSPANHMMAAIKNMFSLILAFYQTLRSHTWHRDRNGGPIKHPNFPQLLKLYEDFCRYSKHFYDVISALAQQNCEPHLQDLVLLLNYNNWFSQR